jgi:peptidoglycan/LPS O-acetylase OafA/YrhL
VKEQRMSETKLKGSSAVDHIYRPEIDGLRAIAVILVLLFHAFPNEVGGGFVGVDVFFVISGYLITGIIARSATNGHFSFLDFYSRRCKRLLPALVTVLLFTSAFGLLVLLPVELGGLGRHLFFSSFFAENFVLLSEAGYFDQDSFRKPLMHLWSLGVEEQFYLFWPVVLILSSKYGRALEASLCLLVGSFAFSLLYFDINPVASFYMLPSRFWELMCGASLFLVEQRVEQKRRGNARPASQSDFWNAASKLCALNGTARAIGTETAAVTAVICMLAFSFLVSGNTLFFGTWAAIPCLTSTALIAIGPRSSISKHILGSSVAAWFGRISYPLYLWHWPLLSLMLTADDGKSSYILRWAALLAAVLLAWLTHVLAERPVKQLKSPLRSVGFASAAALSFLALIGAGLMTHPRYFEQTAWAATIAIRDGIDPVSATNASDREWTHHALNVDKFCVSSKWLGSAVPDYCRLTSDPPKLAIVGDSHANHLVPGLAALDDPNLAQLVQISFGGCIGLVGAYFAQRVQPQSVLQNCNSANERFLEQIRASKTIEVVVISMLARSPGEFEADGGMRAYPKIFEGRQLHSAGMSLVYDALSETVSFFEAAGKRVIFVSDVPYLGIEPAACVQIRSVTFSKKSVDDCRILKSTVVANQLPSQQLLDIVAAKHPKMKVFDSRQVFCDEVFCTAIKGGKMLYRNSNHLSVEGSILWAKSFQEWLRDQKS